MSGCDSSPAYVFLAHVVELAGGDPYHDFLRSSVFGPLRLADTSAGSSEDYSGPRAQGYSGGELAPSFDLDTFGIGAGDVWSSTHDLARWSEALVSGSLLTRDSSAAMNHAHATVSSGARRLHYGYGVFLGTLAGRPAVYHPGDNRGFQAFLAWLPDDQLLVVVLSNDDQTRVESIATDLIGAALTD